MSQTDERAGAVRLLLASEGLDGIFVRSDDRFLNEYVPRDDSTRAWLTGFTGSTGDAFLGGEVGWVAVDGRYHLQAREELADGPFAPLEVELGTNPWTALCRHVAAWAREAGARRLGFAEGRMGVRQLAVLEAELSGIELVACKPSLVEQARDEVDEEPGVLRAVDPARGGGAVQEKLARIAPALSAAGVAGFLLQRLDELAWLVNLRGDALPHQATFRAAALVRPEEVVLALPEPGRVSAPEPGVRLVEAQPGEELEAALSAVERGERIGYDPGGATAAAVRGLEAREAAPVDLGESPLASIRARKSAGELAAMREAFARADRAMENAIDFVRGKFAAGERVTEADLVAEVTRCHEEQGAVGLSFRVIAAAGPNGAHIHYGKPDPERAIEATDLVLIDTGAYFAEGYATDLTRTFLASGEAEPSPEQKARYTHVLRAAAAGMMARFPLGTRGEQLDAMVRAPMWAVGLDYKHGTGHGVGVNVHEAPPRISTQGPTPLEVGQVFSIEPGYYEAGWGGIRIENLCTVVPAAGAEGFLDVEPMTFARLEPNLIDEGLLTPAERTWLERYRARRAEVLG